MFRVVAIVLVASAAFDLYFLDGQYTQRRANDGLVCSSFRVQTIDAAPGVESRGLFARGAAKQRSAANAPALGQRVRAPYSKMHFVLTGTAFIDADVRAIFFGRRVLACPVHFFSAPTSG
jgi:hypothetical protein